MDLKKSGLFLFSKESTTENVVVYSALSAGTGAGAASFFSAATALAFLGLAAGAWKSSVTDKLTLAQNAKVVR